MLFRQFVICCDSNNFSIAENSYESGAGHLCLVKKNDDVNFLTALNNASWLLVGKPRENYVITNVIITAFCQPLPDRYTA